jgi:hypothetical protein
MQTKLKEFNSLIETMGKRWNDEEQSALDEIRSRLKDLIEDRPQFPEGNSIKIC